MHRELKDLPIVDHGIDIIGDEWVQDENERIGLTNYRFQDLPDWAKKAWLEQKQNKSKT
jgi:hypothetical protein